MKKNLFGFIAIVFAIVASAFTILPKQTAKSPNEASLYWFEITFDGSGNIIPLSYDNMSDANPDTKTDALLNNALGCTDSQSPLCLAGYSASQVTVNGNSVTVNSTGGQYVQPSSATEARIIHD